MTRPSRTTLRLACAALLLAHTAHAQGQAPKDLDRLLEQLQKADSATWTARGAAMTDAAGKARAAAAKLKQQAAQRAQAATTEDRAASSLKAEIQKLEQLRGIIVALSFVDPAGKKGAKQTVQGALEKTIAEMRKLPKAAWAARSDAMRSAVASHSKRAAALRAEHQQLLKRASAAAEDGTRLDAEAKKLVQLRQLVGSIEMGLLAKAAPAKPKPAPTKKPAAKPKPKPTPAKKPAPKPKPTPAKKPAAKPKPKPAPAKEPAAKAMAAANAAAPGTAGEALLTYEDHVYQIFDEHCIACHDQGDASGGLDLGAHATTVQGGSSGKTLRPGSPDESRLYLLVSHKEKPTMPPKEPRIDDQLIETIRTWIAQGAPKDRAEAEQLAARRAKARAQAAAEAAAREAQKIVVQVVMPEQLPTVEKRYPVRPGAMRTVAASPGAPLLAAPGFEQVLLLHQQDLRELGALAFPFGQVEDLAFSADASAFVAAGGTPGQRGGAVVYDVRTGAARGSFGARKDAALTAALSPRADLVAVGGTRRRVQVFRTSDGEALWREAHDDWVTAAAFSPDGKLLATADRQGSVAVREATNGREVHDFKAADGIVTSLAFAPDSSSLAASSADRSVSLFRMRDGRQLFKQTAHSDQALCLTWRSASRIVSAGADGRLLTWKTNGSRDPELPRVADWVYGVAASADGARIFTADWQGRLIALDAKTRKVIKAVTPLAVTP